MAELTAKERLQPDLLMRLTDPDRFITVFTITAPLAELERLGVKPDELVSILRGLGLRRANDDAAMKDGDSLRLELLARGQSLAPATVKQLVITPPGAPKGIMLQQFCTIESRSSMNNAVDGADSQVVNSRSLRESVQRELASLLNTMNLAAVQDLSRYPDVERSVLNYGVTNFTGKGAHEVDPKQTAQQIRGAIEFFEPRLRNVQVTPATRDAKADGSVLDFRIDAELWGNPLNQRVTMRTVIEVDSGDVAVSYQAGS